MSSRRRPPADLAAVRRSRSGCTGAITKALDKLKSVPFSSAEEALLINTKDIDRTLVSIEKTETTFLQTLEDAQGFIPEDDESAFQQEEEQSSDAFLASISATRDLGDQLLCTKAVLNGLADFNCDLQALKDSLATKPDVNQVSSFQSLENLFHSLRNQWHAANLPRDHPIKAELDACTPILTELRADVTSACDKSDSHSSSSGSSASGPTYCGPTLIRNDLPTIQVPTFSGEVLEWSSFWASFKSTIEDRKELSNTQKLHYLRQAIKDPEVQRLLHSPTETPEMYLEVVQELKERYNKTREIHRLLVKSLLDLPSPKQNRVELRRLADTVKATLASLNATKFYDLDSFLSSFVYSVLPSRLQTLWDQSTKKDKGIPPITQLLIFIKDHAETLPSSTTSSAPEESSDNSTKNTTPRKTDRKEHHQSKPRSNVHSVIPSTQYRWECSLCRPEKHPLHLCTKWASYTLPQRLSHIQDKGLCSNCLAGGHSTTACKSTYRCRDCSQNHHTTIHQNPATAPLNYSTPKCHQVPDALMTTAQLIITGPGGKELKARALIDSGAGLSLVSERVAQILNLPLKPANLHLSVVQGETSKPLHHITSLHISPLQDRELKLQCKPAVAPTVTGDLPSQAVYPVIDLPHIMGLQLADPDYHQPGRIDILLGADMAPKIMVSQLLRHGKETEPIAQATHFGWVLSGPVRRRHRSTVIPANHQTLIIQTEPVQDHLTQNCQNSEEENSSLPVTEQQVENNCKTNIVFSPDNCRPQLSDRFFSPSIRINVDQPLQDSTQPSVELQHAEEVLAEEQPPDSPKLHREWRSELPALTQNSLPSSHASPNFNINHQKPQGISAASIAAFGAGAYCRTTYHDHPPAASLMTAKLKLTELNSTAMPRQHTIFTTNPMSLIMQATSPGIWHSLTITYNSADSANRGLLPVKLLDHSLQWEGPPWLSYDPGPISKHSPPEDVTVSVVHQPPSAAKEIENLSSNSSIIFSVAAWGRRLCKRLKPDKPEPDYRSKMLSGTERITAEQWLLRKAQTLLFPMEKGILHEGNHFPKTTRLKALHPILDKNMILRIGDRLSNSTLPKSQQQSALSDAKDTFTLKLFQCSHVSFCHCGPSLLLHSAGSSLPATGARRRGRKFLSQCITHRKHQHQMQTQMMRKSTAPRVTLTASLCLISNSFSLLLPPKQEEQKRSRACSTTSSPGSVSRQIHCLC